MHALSVIALKILVVVRQWKSQGISSGRFSFRLFFVFSFWVINIIKNLSRETSFSIFRFPNILWFIILLLTVLFNTWLQLHGYNSMCNKNISWWGGVTNANPIVICLVLPVRWSLDHCQMPVRCPTRHLSDKFHIYTRHVPCMPTRHVLNISLRKTTDHVGRN